MNELDLAIKAATADAPLVQAWMNWMLIILLLSIVFVWKHVPARYVLASLVASFVGAFVVFYLTGNVHLIGIAHIVFWVPLAYYLVAKQDVPKAVNLKTPYGIWITLILLTITISIIFDIRDVILVLMGQK